MPLLIASSAVAAALRRVAPLPRNAAAASLAVWSDNCAYTRRSVGASGPNSNDQSGCDPGSGARAIRHHGRNCSMVAEMRRYSAEARVHPVRVMSANSARGQPCDVPLREPRRMSAEGSMPARPQSEELLMTPTRPTDVHLVPMTHPHWPDLRAHLSRGHRHGPATFEAEPPDRDTFFASKVPELSWVAMSGETGCSG